MDSFKYCFVELNERWPRTSAIVLSEDSAPSRLTAHACLLSTQRYKRHTCAVHLLRSGVDINTIRAWLGHVSLDTTHIYAEVDLEMKAKALALCDQPKETRTRPWHTDAGLMSFLKAL
jgi:Phage integrase family